MYDPIENNAIKTVEGVFDGEGMIGDDGKLYPVQPNYASKSRLVMGDRLKLIMTGDGQFIYKQVLPVKRKRVIGLAIIRDNLWWVLAEAKTYRVLTASMTYYKAQPGDEVVVLIPQDQPTKWAAVDNVIRLIKKQSVDQEMEYLSPN